MLRRLVLPPLAAIALALEGGCRDASPPLAPESGGPPAAATPTAPRALLAVGAPDALRDRWIVTLRPGADARALGAGAGVQADFVYAHALTGFAARMSEAAARALLNDPRVLAVEADGIVAVAATQDSAPWGLDRIDQRSLPLDTTFRYASRGRGVTAYVIDTGIRADHLQFGGRAATLVDEVDGGSAADCHGHGTHVAGILGGATYGVAKEVSLLAVRVLDCQGSGTWSQVIAGIDAVIAHHTAGLPAVANLSLGGSKRASVNAAVKSLVADGVTTVVAAGNGDLAGTEQNACDYSPASTAAALTIGATDRRDGKASFSNYGDCVDWFAPGVEIRSAWFSARGATRALSGTSMAAPHVAGAAALYLEGDPGAAPDRVRGALFGTLTRGVVADSRTANNHLLFTRF